MKIWSCSVETGDREYKFLIHLFIQSWIISNTCLWFWFDYWTFFFNSSSRITVGAEIGILRPFSEHVYSDWWVSSSSSKMLFVMLWSSSSTLSLYWKSFTLQFFNNSFHLKRIVKRAELDKCDIRLVSRILWHKRITPSLKEWRLWHCIFTGNFLLLFLITSVPSAIPVKATYFHQKKLVTFSVRSQ